MSSKLVLCGLGNPGEDYRATRHNLGFWLLDFIADSYGGKWSYPREEYSSCEVSIRGRKALLVKPQTYMNLSGEALAALSEREAIDPERFVVLCDDTALPLGQIRLRRGGSDGGHNGLKSVIYHLNSTEFPRLRLGVGPVPDGIEHADFVLSPFLEEEVKKAEDMIRQAAKCVAACATLGIETAMNRFNKKASPKTPEPDPPPAGKDDSGP